MSDTPEGSSDPAPLPDILHLETSNVADGVSPPSDNIPKSSPSEPPLSAQDSPTGAKPPTADNPAPSEGLHSADDPQSVDEPGSAEDVLSEGFPPRNKVSGGDSPTATRDLRADDNLPEGVAGSSGGRSLDRVIADAQSETSPSPKGAVENRIADQRSDGDRSIEAASDELSPEPNGEDKSEKGGSAGDPRQSSGDAKFGPISETLHAEEVEGEAEPGERPISREESSNAGSGELHLSAGPPNTVIFAQNALSDETADQPPSHGSDHTADDQTAVDEDDEMAVRQIERDDHHSVEQKDGDDQTVVKQQEGDDEGSMERIERDDRTKLKQKAGDDQTPVKQVPRKIAADQRSNKAKTTTLPERSPRIASEILLTRIPNAEGQEEEEDLPPSPPKTSPKRSPRRSVRRESNSPPHLADRFFAGEPVTCDVPETLASTVCELQDRLENVMARNEFIKSAQTLRAVESARAQMLESVKKRNQQEVQADLQAKQESSRQDLDEFNQEMDMREDELEDQLQAKNNVLTKRQLVERSVHDVDWRTEPIVRLFNRSSQKVRVLRVQQQFLLSARRFEEAEQVCKIADRRIVEETIENQYQRFVEYEDSRIRLDQRHADQEDTMRQAGDTRRGYLVSEREKRNRRFTKRFVNLTAEEERAKDPERLWRLAHRNDGDVMVNLVGTARSPAAIVPKKADVGLFNTLPLPQLPPAHTPRKYRPRGSSARWFVAPYS